MSPTAKVFITRNNPYETVSVNASDEQELIEDVRESDAPGLLTAVGGYCVNGVDVLEGVKNVDALEMFEMILEEKKEFEWRQAQFFQEFIKKQSNSKKEIETLMADKQELQETVEVSILC